MKLEKLDLNISVLAAVNMSKTALIIGITGQDGSYLSQLLLDKHYRVVGMISGKNDIGDQNIAEFKDKLVLAEGDLLDQNSIDQLIKTYLPDEIYNLGGITFVPTSWDKPVLTHDVNALGPLRILQAIRNLSPKSRFFQASSAKIFGQSKEEKQTEQTEYNPKDPYGVSKLSAHLNTQMFRQQFGIFACCGIMYNHESPRRGPEFVTRKITQGAVRIKSGLADKLALGNLDAKADWGWAPDYVEAMWLMLQQNKADDFILASGEIHTVREVCQIAFNKLGLDYQKFVTINKEFYRPASKKIYYGDPDKAIKLLGWQKRVGFKEMIEKMIDYDLKVINKNL